MNLLVYFLKDFGGGGLLLANLFYIELILSGNSSFSCRSSKILSLTLYSFYTCFFNFQIASLIAGYIFVKIREVQQVACHM